MSEGVYCAEDKDYKTEDHPDRAEAVDSRVHELMVVQRVRDSGQHIHCPFRRSSGYKL